MNEYYNEIKNRIIDNEIYSKVKDYTKERNRVITYFEIGKILSEAGSKYGDKVIETYSKKLIVEVGKQYNKRTLYRMKKFYNMFKNETVTPLVTQLTWTHYVILMSIKDKNEIYYYIEVCKHQNLSKRELETRIKNNRIKKRTYRSNPNIYELYRQNLKTINEEETIGIIIVKKDNKYILEYCSDKRVLSKEYILN